MTADLMQLRTCLVKHLGAVPLLAHAAGLAFDAACEELSSRDDECVDIGGPLPAALAATRVDCRMED
jgi:hypothetical protein